MARFLGIKKTLTDGSKAFDVVIGDKYGKVEVFNAMNESEANNTCRDLNIALARGATAQAEGWYDKVAA